MSRAEGTGSRLDRDREAFGRWMGRHGVAGFELTAPYADHLRDLILANLDSVLDHLFTTVTWELCWNCDERTAAEFGLCAPCAEAISFDLPRRS